MIQVFKSYFAPPSILISNGCIKKNQKAIIEKNTHKFSYYYAHEDVKEALEIIYNEKCAYCESKTKHITSLQVEHYRPKAKVEKNLAHNGYYWLGYEWSNLLLACPKCNDKGAKGNKFPISGVRVMVHSAKSLADKSPLIDEEPLLLNPEIDNPREHFRFNTDGKIESDTIRGIKTIEICRLDRIDLNHNRQKEIIDDIFNSLKILIKGFTSSSSMPKETFIFMLKDIFNNLKKKENPSHSYSLLGWYTFENFDKFVKAHIETSFQKPIVDAWKKYRNEKL